jgi:DNA-binding LacI/PurR family transcriptional regulator
MMTPIDTRGAPPAPAGPLLLAKQRVILSTLVSVVHGVEASAEERGASSIEVVAASDDETLPADTERMRGHRLDGAIFELSHAGDVQWTCAQENDGARISIRVTERSLSGHRESLSASAWSASDNEAIERTRRALGFKVLRHLISRGPGAIKVQRHGADEFVSVAPTDPALAP